MRRAFIHRLKLEGSFALFPIVFFLILFIGSGSYLSYQATSLAFYQISATVAILPAIILSISLGKGTLNEKILTFIEGVRDQSIIIMCMIYLLAGAYTEILKNIGSVEATVNIALTYLPPQAILPGIFMISAAIATAMGTSMGTIAAIAPIAFGIAQASGISLPLTMGTVIGGAMFGDNLSMISDTTIAAVQTQGGTLQDKFKINGLIALPAMALTLIVLMIQDTHKPLILAFNSETFPWILSIPYFLVLGLALCGLNVFLVLMIGIISAGIVGLVFTPDYSLIVYAKNIYQGYGAMQEILILSLLIGGLSHLTKHQGGLKYIMQVTSSTIQKLSQRIAKSSLAEAAIALIVSICDICTANNVIAIILAGETSHELAKKYGIDPSRAATIVDLFSCVFQGLLPYSAQILLAGSIAGLSPFSIIPHVYYCFALCFIGILAIIFQWPHLSQNKNKK